MVEFGMPTGIWRPFWWLYTRIGLPLLGRVVSARWSAVGSFLGPSIDRFYADHPLAAIERYWRAAGLDNVRTRRMSLGGGVVMTATKVPARRVEPPEGSALVASAPVAAEAPGAARLAPEALAPEALAPKALAPAFYAAHGGGWRDYWTLLHPPYTAWHLSYVLLGAALSPAPDPRIVAGALVAFGLAVGVGAHAFDELRGRPLGTRIPSLVLVSLGTAALAVAIALGLVATTMLGPLFLLFVVGGPAIVLAYGFEVPFVHSDLGFALGWGAFPVVTTAFATGAHLVPTAFAALAATLLSLAQRRLSTRARSIRRRAVGIRDEIVSRDGAHEPIDARALIGAPEGALSILWIALCAVALAVLLAHWV
jgi:hypothetical protein